MKKSFSATLPIRRFLALSLGLLWLLAETGLASHFRGSSASYSISSSGVVTVNLFTVWRIGAVNTATLQMRTGPNGGGTYLGNFVNATTVNPYSTGTEYGGSGFTVVRQTMTFNLSGQSSGTYYAYWSSCCRVSGINNAPESTWATELKIIYTSGQESAGPTMIPATIDIIGRGYDYNQNLNSVDPDRTPVSYQLLTGSSAPNFGPTANIPGLSLSSAGTVSISAANTATLALGRWVYKVRVTDGTGATAERDVLVVVQDPLGNLPPVLNPIGNKTVPVGSQLSFNVSGTDPNASQTVTVRAQLVPTGASFPSSSGTTSASSQFNWTPTAGQEGNYLVNFEIYDNATTILIDSELVQITVTGLNNPPVLNSIGSRSVANGGTLAFTISGNDPDPGQSVTYAAFNLPAGASFNPVTGVFSWTPTSGQYNSTFTGITFRATDNGTPNLNDDETIAITVGAGNQAPVIAPVASQSVIIGQTLQLQVEATDANFGQTVLLTVGSGGLPPGASFPSASGPAGSLISSLLSWTPTIGQVGSYNIRFRAEDNGIPILNSEIVVPITVAAGLPVANNDTAVVAEDSGPNVLAVLVNDSDAIGGGLSITAVTQPLHGVVSIGAGATSLSYTPAADYHGPDSFTYTISDSQGGTSSATVGLTVAPVNDAPIANNLSLTVAEDSATIFNVTGSDIDGPSVSYLLVTGPAHGGLLGTPPVFSYTPAANYHGPDGFTFKLNDSLLDSAIATVTINVTPVNDAPVLASPGHKVVNELELLAFTLVATDDDLPGDTLTYSIASGFEPGMALDSSSGAFTWTPTEMQGPGTYNVTFRVTDAAGAPSEQTITITVTEVNAIPVLSDVPAEATIPELVSFTFDAAGNDSDAPVQNLTFSLVGAPDGATIDSVSGVFNWTPAENQGAGDYAFSVRISDSVTTADVPILLHVTEVNVPPVLTSPGNQSVDEGSNLAFILAAMDTDLPANGLSYSIQAGGLPGMSLNPATGQFSWTPTEAQGPNTYNVTFRATDTGNPVLSHDQTIAITVNEVNVAPVLANVPAEATIPEMAAYSFDASASDDDVPVQTLTFSLVGAPTGATIDSGSGVFSWTPAENQGPADYTFTVRVSDGVVNTDQSVTLHVTEVNRVPVLTSPGNQAIDEQTELAFTLGATDPDLLPGNLAANSLTYSIAGGLQAGMSLNVLTGQFSWSPTEAQGPDTYSVTFRATDNGDPTLFHEQTITITANEVNVAPVLTDVPAETTIPEMATYSFDANASDEDVPVQTLTFSLVGAPVGATIDSGSGVFSWTPAENQGPNDYTFTVRVSDGVVNTDQSITLHVTEVNQAPSLTSPGPKTVDEQTALAFSLNASDPDLLANGSAANTLAYSIVSVAEPGMTVDPTTGAFSWTPTEQQGPASYTVTFRVLDNGDQPLDSQQTITITVNEVNRRPTLVSPGDRTFDEQTLLAISLSASDPDLLTDGSPANSLDYSIASGQQPGMAITATGAFTWTPTEAQGPSVYPVTFRVTDTGNPALSHDQTVNLTVREVNIAPVLDDPGNQSIMWGNLLSFSLTAGDVDVPANGLTYTISAGAQPGMNLVPGTGAFTWTPTSAQLGTWTVTFRVTDDGAPNLAHERTITIEVGRRATLLVYGGELSRQYSDRPGLSATLSDSGGGAADGSVLAGMTINFDIGAQDVNALTDALGVAATTNLALAQAPGAYNVVSSFAGDTLYLPATDTDPFSITKEDARALYTGALFVSTKGTNDGSAIVTLSATIQDITALTNDPAWDGDLGDIRKATVTFINRDNNSVIATVPVGLVTAGDTLTGTATHNWSVNIGTAPSLDYTVGIIVNSHYTRNASDDNVVVTVSKPIGRGFITGGGYLVVTDSAGLVAGGAGTKNNFGFNVINDRRGPKGRINTIIRNNGRVYQIKGNAMTSLSIDTSVKAGHPYPTAVFNGKASIQDITDPLAPIAVDGNATLQVTMTDAGEPGSSDTIGITVWNKAGGLWYASSWNGTKTIEKFLGGGNLQVR